MLFIYGGLTLGGIETFFVRLAKERSNRSLVTVFVLLCKESDCNEALLAEAKKYADVYFMGDILRVFPGLSFGTPIQLSLIAPLNEKVLTRILSKVRKIHVANSLSAYFALRIMDLSGFRLPVSIGVYHSLEYTWGTNLPFFEKVNRDLFFDAFPRKNIVFFNDLLPERYSEVGRGSFAQSSVFPIGVVGEPNEEKIRSAPNANRPLTLGSIGRLVAFKSYNIWMLYVVKDLLKEGFRVKYIVYGDGPLKSEMEETIARLGLAGAVELRGRLDYSLFDSAVGEFDIFVGSGTAIVQAAHCGVPSIIGVEGEAEPKSYGYFSDIPGFTYNEDGLYPKKDVIDIIRHYSSLDCHDVVSLRKLHIEKAGIFSMKECVDNFEKVDAGIVSEQDARLFNRLWLRLKYTLNLLAVSAMCKLRGVSLYDLTRREN